MHGVFGYLVETALKAQESKAPDRAFNPRPPGVIQEGGATEAVKQLFDQHPDHVFSFEMIAHRVPKTKRAIDWALTFLRAHGYIDATPGGDGRNPRYNTYKRAKQHG